MGDKAETHPQQETAPTVEHSHAAPIQKITLTIDPNHGQWTWDFENIDIAEAIQRLAMAQLLMFAKMNHVTGHPHEHV